MSDYPQTSVSCIVRTQYPYFAQRYAGITGFGPVVLYALKFLTQPLQKHQQEADQQQRTGSPDCGDSKVQGHDTSCTCSNGKEENNAKIIEKLPQLLRLVLLKILTHIPAPDNPLPNIFHNKTNHTDSPLHHQAISSFHFLK